MNADSHDALKAFLDTNEACVLVTVTKTKGSTPREQGAFMFVSVQSMYGTIGGGQLEYSTIDKARQMLVGGERSSSLVVKLGPEIGQCCGGEVSLSLELLSVERRKEIVVRDYLQNKKRPHVYIFGAGHVGNALVNAFVLLPVEVVLVDQRARELAAAPSFAQKLHMAMPEQLVKSAPSGSAFLVLTHDHALDFLIVKEALERDDASYVGMIGSKSKRGTFRNWYLREGGTAHALSKLVCPIGGNFVNDKRPAIIAAFAIAEVIAALLSKVGTGQPLETMHV